MPWKRGRAKARTRPRTISTPLSCGRATTIEPRLRARSTARPARTVSGARRRDGARRSRRSRPSERPVSVRGGRSLRRQIEAGLSGEADPLGDEGLGLPDQPNEPGPEDMEPIDVEEAGAPIRRGRRGQARHVDDQIRKAYAEAQEARVATDRDAA